MGRDVDLGAQSIVDLNQMRNRSGVGGRVPDILFVVAPFAFVVRVPAVNNEEVAFVGFEVFFEVAVEIDVEIDER